MYIIFIKEGYFCSCRSPWAAYFSCGPWPILLKNVFPNWNVFSFFPCPSWQIRMDGLRLFLVWFMTLQENSTEEAYLIYATLIHGFPTPPALSGNPLESIMTHTTRPPINSDCKQCCLSLVSGLLHVFGSNSGCHNSLNNSPSPFLK